MTDYDPTVFLVARKEAADIHKRVFFRGHRAAVRQVTDIP